MGKRPGVAGSHTQDTSGLICQCSVSEPQQPDNHQPSQSSICTLFVLPDFSLSFIFTCVKQDAVSSCNATGKGDVTLHSAK